jgi:hypothetical protein
MRHKRERARTGRGGIRRLPLAVVMIAVVSLAAMGAASPASANLKQELQKFSNCPYNNPVVTECIYSLTNSGEFVIGNSSVPISKPVVIQAGLRALGFFVPATNGETLSKTALPVPGGLVGIELPGDFTSVTATAELAGQAQLATSITLPLKVKLDNLVLGSNCYIGSEAEPLTLHLIYGTTNPPPPNTPISGKVTITQVDSYITQLVGTLVDNAFSAPGATGCTLLPLVGDLAVNLKEGLPAAAGKNTAIMSGTTEETPSRAVRGILPLPAFGRCVKAIPNAEGKKLAYHGSWANSKCTLENQEKAGKFEWVPGPGPKPKFTGSGKTLTLQTVGKALVTCLASSSAGEYTGAKTQTLAMTLTGCFLGPKASGVACQSASAAAGEIRTATLEGGLDFIKEGLEPEVPIVGVDLKPASGTSIAGFECGGKSVSVGGSVIVPVSAVDGMVPSFKLKAMAGGGIQSPEAFEGGVTDTLSWDAGSGAEQAGLKTTQTNVNEEPLEIKAIL